MRIATWNVNSVRSRVGRIVDWLGREEVDVLAMQEIKCTEAQFPMDEFGEAGYEVQLHGLNQWNGVAIASRYPMDDVQIGFDGMPGFLKGEEGPDLPLEARAIGATVNGVRLWSLYVPNGRALGDPHYDYKLDWLEALAADTRDWLTANPDSPLALMGDCNVAPLDSDVGDPTLRPRRLDAHLAARARGVRRVRGRRTDRRRAARSSPTASPTGTTSSSASRATRGCASTSSSARRLRRPGDGRGIHRNERKGDAPSDHVPVLVDLDVDDATTTTGR